MSFIDPPSKFDDLQKWTSFKREVEAAIKASPDQDGLVDALREANEVIAEKTRGD